MRLMVFDLDTALCQSSTMDGLALANAIKDVAGIEVGPQAIGSFIDLKAVWYQVTSQMASPLQMAELRARYTFHLRRQFIIRPSVVSANYSLIEQVNSMMNHKNVVVGFISVMTQQALSLKARSIGLLCDSAPIATGDDADTLDGLLQTMKTRVRRSFGINFESAMVVGGDEWLQAANNAQFEYCSAEEYAMQTIPSARRSFADSVRQSIFG